MASRAAQFDLSTSFLDQPNTMAYGLVRGAGNLILQHELADKSRVGFIILGEGPWDSILRLWLNNKQVTLPSANVHFHPGLDGEIGNGLALVSTGGDQHVDSFFSLIPGGLDPVTFSRRAWLAIKVPTDAAAPSAQLTYLADYQAMQVRQFDAAGNQTSFAWTQNWAWIICDFLLRKFVLREAKVNQPLVTAELARFDWASFSAAATYYDAILSGGQKRFSDGGVVYANSGETADKALEQMLLLCRSYILERNGKLSLYADQPRASVFTFRSDNIAPQSFKAYKTNLRGAPNRLTPTFRDLNIALGSTDDATRFAIAGDPEMNHEAHQRYTGARGPGLSVMANVKPLTLDLGNNTPERVWRILNGMLVRTLGDDVDVNSLYNAPFTYELRGFEDSIAVEPGDLATIDASISEEHAGKLFEVTEPTYNPDGTIDYLGLEYMANAFPDTAPVQQWLEAPVPGAGLTPGLTVDENGNLVAINYMGGVVVIDNADFEASANMVNGAPPGWMVDSANTVATYETSSQQSGNRSLKCVFSGTFGNVFTIRKFKVNEGELYRISGYMKTLAGVAGQIQAWFADASGAFVNQAVAQTTAAGWTFVSGTGTVPTGAVYMVIRCGTAAGVAGTVWYDNVHVIRAATAFEVTPINTSGHATVGGGALSQSGISGTANVASKTIQYGDGQVTYNAGSVSPGLGTWFVYGDDPGFAGGAVTYQASANEFDVYGANGRIFFGKITLSGGGGGTSTNPPGSGGGKFNL